MVVVSDGVLTAGDVDGEPLRAAVKELAAAGVERLDAVVVGGIRDQDRLAQLVTAGLPRDGAVIEGGEGAEAIAAHLTRRSRSGIVVAVEGADWWWPRRLDAVQAGDQALVFARVPAGRPVRVLLDGAAVEVAADARKVDRPLVERAIARAEIASLVAERDAIAPAERGRRDAVRDRIVALSTARRVLSPFTALLVLETEDDYARFGIDRKALADILSVRDGGLDLVRRTESALVIATSRPQGRQGKAEKRKGAASSADKADDVGVAGKDRGDIDGPTDAEDEKKATDDPARPEAPGDVAMERRAPSADQPSPPRTASIEQAEESTRSQPEAEPALSGTGTASGGSAAPAEAPAATTTPAAPPAPRRAIDRDSDAVLDSDDARPDSAGQAAPRVDPYTGRFRAVMQLLRRKKVEQAVTAAAAWRAESPGDVMALVAMGETLEAARDLGRAARAYGSIIDMFPQRADLRRFAGQRLDRIADPAALALAADTYARAAEQRADHPSSHRLLAYALVKQGKHAEAFAALERGLAQRYPEDRFRGVRQILAEDLGLVGAAWTRAEPARAKEIRNRLRQAGGTAENGPSIRFVLHWETDANDVDFHIRDGKGNHAFYSQPELASGGRLYADVTTGYGPECFTIRGPRKGRAHPYKLEAHYYSRGPMGYGMGKLQVIEHDGKGNLRFEERPFQIMQDNAFVDLGTVRK